MLTKSPDDLEQMQAIMNKQFVCKFKANLMLISDEKYPDTMILYQHITSDGDIPKGCKLIDGQCMLPIVALQCDASNNNLMYVRSVYRPIPKAEEGVDNGYAKRSR